MSGYIRGADNTLYDPITKEPVGRLGADGQEHLYGSPMVNPATGSATAYVDKSGTPGAATINSARGRAAIAASASSVVITNNRVTTQSIVLVHLDATSADGTLTSIQRVSVANGSFTVYGNAAATAATPFRFSVQQ